MLTAKFAVQRRHDLEFQKRERCGQGQSGKASWGSSQFQYGVGKMVEVKLQGVGKTFQAEHSGVGLCLDRTEEGWKVNLEGGRAVADCERS